MREILPPADPEQRLPSGQQCPRVGLSLSFQWTCGSNCSSCDNECHLQRWQCTVDMESSGRCLPGGSPSPVSLCVCVCVCDFLPSVVGVHREIPHPNSCGAPFLHQDPDFLFCWLCGELIVTCIIDDVRVFHDRFFFALPQMIQTNFSSKECWPVQ